MDYLEKDQDAKRVGIEGHSRFGKAALVAMACEPRFAIAYISPSGEGGAKLHRRNYGEVVENIAAPNLYHWVAGSFLKYAGPLHWDDLPVDAHELIAPRARSSSAAATRAIAGWMPGACSWLPQRPEKCMNYWVKKG